MSTFEGTVSEYPYISMDRFDGRNLDSSYFILSHAHQDHMVGLESDAFLQVLRHKNFELICHCVTKAFLVADDRYARLEPYINTLDVKTPISVEGPAKHAMPALWLRIENDDMFGIEIRNFNNNCMKIFSPFEDEVVTITLLPAGHCPGSVMVLLEGPKGNVLYTGDIRLSRKVIRHMRTLKPNTIDSLHIDTTFLLEDKREFPDREESAEKLIQQIKSWLDASPSHKVLLWIAYKCGHEYLLNRIAKDLNLQIHVTDQKYAIYAAIPHDPLVQHLTKDGYSARVHCCKTWMRDDDAANAVENTVMAPQNTFDTPVSPSRSVTNAQMSPAKRVTNAQVSPSRPISNAQASPSRRNFDVQVSPCRGVSAAQISRRHVTDAQVSPSRGVTEAPISPARKSAASRRWPLSRPCAQCPWNSKDVLVIKPSSLYFLMLPNFDKNKIMEKTPSYLRLFYSMHSSFEELRELVAYLRPRRVFANVIPPGSSAQKVSEVLNSLLADVLTPTSTPETPPPLMLRSRKIELLTGLSPTRNKKPKRRSNEGFSAVIAHRDNPRPNTSKEPQSGSKTPHNVVKRKTSQRAATKLSNSKDDPARVRTDDVISPDLFDDLDPEPTPEKSFSFGDGKDPMTSSSMKVSKKQNLSKLADFVVAGDAYKHTTSHNSATSTSTCLDEPDLRTVPDSQMAPPRADSCDPNMSELKTVVPDSQPLESSKTFIDPPGNNEVEEANNSNSTPATQEIVSTEISGAKNASEIKTSGQESQIGTKKDQINDSGDGNNDGKSPQPLERQGSGSLVTPPCSWNLRSFSSPCNSRQKRRVSNSSDDQMSICQIEGDKKNLSELAPKISSVKSKGQNSGSKKSSKSRRGRKSSESPQNRNSSKEPPETVLLSSDESPPVSLAKTGKSTSIEIIDEVSPSASASRSELKSIVTKSKSVDSTEKMTRSNEESPHPLSASSTWTGRKSRIQPPSVPPKSKRISMKRGVTEESTPSDNNLLDTQNPEILMDVITIDDLDTAAQPETEQEPSASASKSWLGKRKRSLR